MFRYIAPLYMKKSCLGCHGGHAGKTTIPVMRMRHIREGNLWGAISVIAPLRLIHASVKSNIIILICIALGLCCRNCFYYILMTKRLITRPHFQNITCNGRHCRR
ncbi:c-type heme family protein [Candidatus Kuenenia stuttgartensis]|uniref:c-type heme family protein n=1 Tax=Kuenenia stuttgartiensis TaxID=174633 RepID=UPI003B9694A3